MWRIYHELLRWAKVPSRGIRAIKRTEITIENCRTLTIRRERAVRVWCAECGCEVEAVDLAQAEVLRGTIQPQLEDSSGAKVWHCMQGPDGTLLVCLESLLKSM